MEIEKIQTGDIILFGGSNGIMGRLIRYFDKATYTHIGIAFEIEEKIFVLDMWTQGIELVPLSKRKNIYPKIKVLRPKNQNLVKEAIRYIIEIWVNKKDIGYDYFLLPRIAIAKRLKIDILAWGRADKWICSELVQVYCNHFTQDFSCINLITPEDFNRYKSDSLYY